MPKSLDDLARELRDFVHERNWAQFHAPKNLAIALMVEAAEVAEHFQWSTLDESANPGPGKRQAIAMEIGDTLLYLVRLADVLGIDPIEAASAKMKLNAERYPVERAYGRSAKYDEL